MGDIRDTASDTYRDYETDGIPASGVHEPSKTDIRALFGVVEDAVSLAGENGSYILKDTKALLDGDLDHAANTYALVQFDSTDAQNGYYKKSGATGTGSWTFLGADPRVAAAAAAEAAQAAAETAADTAIAANSAALSVSSNVLAGMGGDLSAFFTTKKGDETLNNQTFTAGTWGHVHPDTFGADGILSTLGVNVSASGIGRFFVRDPETETVTWLADLTLASGENDFIGGLDFDLVKVKRGQSLGFYVTSGSGEIKTGPNAAGGQKYFASASAPDVGDTISAGALISWTAPWGLSYTLVSADDPTAEPTEIRSRVRAVSQRFSGVSTPAGWTLGAAFSVNNGLVSSGSGGWGNYTYNAVYSSLAQREIAARVTFGSATSKYAIACKPNPAGAAQFYGGALVIDGTTSKLGIYTWTGTSSAGVLVAEEDAPTLSTTAPYVLRVRVDDQSVVGELVDDAGEVVASVTADSFFATGSDSAAFKGGVAAIHFAGSVTATWIEAYHRHPERLKVLIVSDSNASATVAVGIGKTWPMRLADLRPQKDIALSATGSDAGEWLTRLTLDLNLFQPEKVLLALGSNYASQATWRTDILSMTAAIVATGAEPVIATQIPNGDNQSLMNAMNTDILSGYFGDLRIVDIAAAVTNDGDRVTWHWPGTENGDHKHLSLAGQIAAFEYVRDNCPWLWRDEPNAFLT